MLVLTIIVVCLLQVGMAYTGENCFFNSSIQTDCKKYTHVRSYHKPQTTKFKGKFEHIIWFLLLLYFSWCVLYLVSYVTAKILWNNNRHCIKRYKDSWTTIWSLGCCQECCTRYCDDSCIRVWPILPQFSLLWSSLYLSTPENSVAFVFPTGTDNSIHFMQDVKWDYCFLFPTNWIFFWLTFLWGHLMI